MLKAKRGDLSGPVLAILVTLILLAIGAVIIAYFTLFAGTTPTPVLVVKDQPIAYKSGSNDAVVEVVVANIGTAAVTLKASGTILYILSPFTDSEALGASPSDDVAIAPGASTTLKFTFSGDWNSNFKLYRSASARLHLVDTADNTIAIVEVGIRIIGGG